MHEEIFCFSYRNGPLSFGSSPAFHPNPRIIYFPLYKITTFYYYFMALHCNTYSPCNSDGFELREYYSLIIARLHNLSRKHIGLHSYTLKINIKSKILQVINQFVNYQFTYMFFTKMSLYRL